MSRLRDAVIIICFTVAVCSALIPFEKITDPSACRNDSDCVYNGRCVPLEDGNKSSAGICYCSRSCDATVVPLECSKSRHCLTGNYCDKEQKLCLCKSSETESCAKRNLEIILLNVSRDTPYLGEHIRIQCCLNIDPRSVKMRWYHNISVELRSTETPDQFAKCFNLDINSVQYKDSGLYTCKVWTDGLKENINKSLPIQVRGSKIFARVNVVSNKDDNNINGVGVGGATITDNSPITLRLNATPLNSSSILAEWIVSPVSHLGVSLRVETVDRRTTFEKRNIMEETSLTITKLKPGTWYNIIAETVPFKDNRTATDKAYIQTKEARPGSPQLTEMRIQDKAQRTKCSVSWRPPVQTNGRILFYELEMVGVVRRLPAGDKILAANHFPKSSSTNCQDLKRVPADHQFMVCEFENLLPNRNYSSSIVAVNSAGRSEPSFFNDSCLTDFAPPEHKDFATPAAHLNGDLSTISVHFGTPPDELNGPITCYYLAIVPFTHNTSSMRWKIPEHMDIESYERAVETNLYVEHQPKFAYIAESYKNLPKSTQIGDENEQNDRCSVYYLSRYSPKDGPLIKKYKYTGFLIARVDPDETITKIGDSWLQQLQLLKVGKKLRRAASSWLQPTYIFSDYIHAVTIQDPAEPILYADGDDEPGKSSLDTIEPISTNETSSMYILTILLSILVAIFVLVALGLIYFLHKKGLLKHWLCFETNFVPHRNSFQELQRLPRDFPPIAVENIAHEYLEKHRNSDFMFTVEFEALPHFNEFFQTIASDRTENSNKNRYNDIKAYDSTRVKLSTINDDSNSDYINANFIQGYKSRKKFIAAQGPMQDTVNDFWRMIWEMDIRIIIMVTNLQEKYRTMCVKYWPEQGNAIYGSFEIKPLDNTFYSDYVVRRFAMKKSEIGQPTDKQVDRQVHEIVQYHYTGWNDYRAPEGTIGLLKFLKTLRKVDEYNETTVLVHCSAGVGRTGTFIAIDAIVDQVEEEQRADVFGFVSNMRRQRNFMVQSLEQYVFVYKALAELYLFGDTDVEVERIEEHVKEIRMVNEENGESGLQKEFSKLSCTLDDAKSTEVAEKPQNLTKNRYDVFLPHDRNRVILQPVLGHVDASYINASVVKGYFYPYILTQDPLSNTVWDFWRAVVEQNVACIVMMSDEESLESGEKYWPTELGRSLAFGTKPTINVQLTAEEVTQNCTVRRMTVNSTKNNGEHREVAQFVYRDWAQSRHASATITPKATCSLLDLIGKVLQRQSSLHDPGPIVVHCSNGSSRSGLYCAVSLLLERLRAEQRVDVFQTVKTLQAQRPFVIPSLEQYDFCYQSVLDYLQSFQ